MRKQDQIILTEEERTALQEVITKGQHSARQIKHANILLKAAAGWTDTATAQAFEVCERTVKRVRRRFVEEGLEATLIEKPRSGRPVEYGAGEQALIIATACTPAPQGYERWSVRLLSRRLAELGVEGISRETVRRTLKKTNYSPSAKSSGVSAKSTDCF